MEISFIIALYHIEITENLGKGDKLDNVTFISNDASVSKGLIPTDAIDVIGQLEYNGLLSAKAFVYSSEKLPDNMTPESYLVDRLYFVQSFLSAIWLKMDNNIDFELGFAFYKKDGGIGVSSNYLALAYTNAHVESKNAILNREKLREIRTLHRDKVIYIKNSHKDRKETQLLKKYSRFEMTLYHIQAARAESDIGLKISNYCSALEALFSTSQAELAHQLSERLAYCISKSPEERLVNYKKSKQAYTIRSKVVHGTYIKENNLPQVKDIASFCDTSLRMVMSNLLMNDQLYKSFSSGNEVLDEYMLNLIFGIIETK